MVAAVAFGTEDEMHEIMRMHALPRQVDEATLDRLEAEVAAAREAVFSLANTARDSVPHSLTHVHVSLQIVANELGLVEHALLDARDRAVAAA
jgi:hypothetical protein